MLGFLSIYGLVPRFSWHWPDWLSWPREPTLTKALRRFDKAAKSHVRRAMRTTLGLPQVAGPLEDEPERGGAKLGAELSQDHALASYRSRRSPTRTVETRARLPKACGSSLFESVRSLAA
jgi:hypothetical protein